MSKVIPIKPGLRLEFLVIRFNAGWEFDCPVIVLKPVLRFYEDGRSCESAIEDVLISACIDGEVRDDSKNWRQWNTTYLRRKAAAALRGVKFKRAWAFAARETAEFALNSDGNLTVKGWGDEVQP